MIKSFRGENRFLSNFYPVPIKWHGLLFSSVEHAYQAAKATNDDDRKKIQKCSSPGAAKRMGKIILLRSDWEEIKLDVMYQLLKQKFSQPDFRQRLLSTYDQTLIEGNEWGDEFWGVCRGKGENHLGKLLMKVREEVK